MGSVYLCDSSASSVGADYDASADDADDGCDDDSYYYYYYDDNGAD